MRDIQSAVVVTPSNTVALAEPTLGFIAATAGNITVDMWRNGTNITIPILAATFYPFRVAKIYATGTTATGIVALY